MIERFSALIYDKQIWKRSYRLNFSSCSVFNRLGLQILQFWPSFFIFMGSFSAYLVFFLLCRLFIILFKVYFLKDHGLKTLQHPMFTSTAKIARLSSVLRDTNADDWSPPDSSKSAPLFPFDYIGIRFHFVTVTWSTRTTQKTVDNNHSTRLIIYTVKMTSSQRCWGDISTPMGWNNPGKMLLFDTLHWFVNNMVNIS